MIINEDGDIKIFKPAEKADQNSDILSFVEGLSHHRQNGNVDKAKELGASIALAIYEDTQSDNMNAKGFPQDHFMQRCALMLFSVEAALNYYLPSQQLSAIAIDSLHNNIQEKNLDFYHEIIEGPAFSFYYLGVRKGGDNIPKDIGEAFAMLCGHTNDHAFIEEGKHLYTVVLLDIETKILNLKFEN